MDLSFRVDVWPLPEVPRRADIIFRGARVAVFVDGCFLHGCALHGTWPKANAVWWRKKIEGNQQRDMDTDRTLQDAGWLSLWAWEQMTIWAWSQRSYIEG